VPKQAIYTINAFHHPPISYKTYFKGKHYFILRYIEVNLVLKFKKPVISIKHSKN